MYITEAMWKCLWAWGPLSARCCSYRQTKPKSNNFAIRLLKKRKTLLLYAYNILLYILFRVTETSLYTNPQLIKHIYIFCYWHTPTYRIRCHDSILLIPCTSQFFCARSFFLCNYLVPSLSIYLPWSMNWSRSLGEPSDEDFIYTFINTIW